MALLLHHFSPELIFFLCSNYWHVFGPRHCTTHLCLVVYCNIWQSYRWTYLDDEDHDENDDDGHCERESWNWNWICLKLFTFISPVHCFPCYSIEIEFVRNISTLFPQPNSIKLQHLNSWSIKNQCKFLHILCFAGDSQQITEEKTIFLHPACFLKNAELCKPIWIKNYSTSYCWNWTAF